MAGLEFERTFVAVSYGLVATAFLAVALSGEVGLVAPVLFGVAFFGSLLRRSDGPPRPGTARVWTALLFAAFGTLILWSLNDGNWLLHALEFALLMTVSRLFQRRFAKDWLQLYVLTFLLMLVAAVIHPSPTFAVCFLVYTVLAIWGLTMVHLVRDIEVQTRTGPEHLLPASPPSRGLRFWRRPSPVAPSAVDALPPSPVAAETLHWRRRRMIGGRFLLVSSLMALAVLMASMVFFFLFPRLGMGFFFARTRGSQSVVGFSDQVRLGNFGKLKSSTQVVMRVRYPEDPARLQRPVRIRGLSFDRWDGRAWSRLTDPDWELLHRGDRYPIPSTPQARRRFERIYGARVYLEPFDADVRVLFAPPQTLWVEFTDSQFDNLRGRRKAVRQAVSGDLSFKAPLDTALSYAVQSVEPLSEEARLALLARAEGTVPRWVRDRWTEVPDDLDPRIRQLARELTRGQDTAAGSALAMARGLRDGWTYSLEGDQDPDAPLLDFLFGKKEGHCEYFATAMALMMRSLGHPARVVNGFYGGELNDFGDYRMIRQGDAHSWVEVYLPGLGWRTFEPTPPSGQLADDSDGPGAAVRRLLDGAAMLWYTWVVEYDLERQVEVFRQVGRTLRKLGGGLNWSRSSGPSAADRPERPEERKPSEFPLLPLAAGLFAAVSLGLGLRWWLLRQRRAAGRFDPRLERATRRLQRRLQALGLPRQPWQTWTLVAQAVRPLDPAAADALQRFAQAYDRARFAPDQPEPDRLEAVRRADLACDALRQLAVRQKGHKRAA